jgi:very-short-patch-repair endonuclease
LKNRNLGGFKFRRHHPIPPYIDDFVCLEQNLIVELDGGQRAEQVASDGKRTAYLQSKGYRALRFWNHDVLQQTESALTVILQTLTSPHPCPLPASGARGNPR